MKKNNGVTIALASSYWKLFRIFFVVFSLDFIRIVFYSWDGFTRYGLFSDFLVGFSLIFILGSGFTAVLTIFLCFSFKAAEWCSIRKGWKIRVEHLLIFVFISLLLYCLWKSNLPIFKYIHFPRKIHPIITAGILVLAALLTMPLRNKAASYIKIIQERITPLVWLFGAFALFSLALVSYNIIDYQIKEKNKTSLFDINRDSSARKNSPNIILVTFDALTSWNMSTYGYLYGDDRETTPFISKWARNASIFSMAEASSNYTIPTTASLMTGKRVWSHGLRGPHSYTFKSDTRSLPQLLKKNGYYNISLIQNTILSVETLGISESFDITIPVEEFMEPKSIVRAATKWLYQLFGDQYRTYNILFQSYFLEHVLFPKIPIKVSLTEYPPEKVFNRFLKMTENTLPEPFFAWLHVFPPHDPYLPPSPFMGMYDPSRKLRTEKSQWLSADFDTARARYDEFIRYCDNAFKKFINGLTGNINNTVIILSSDHGHSFAHNYRGHGGPHLYEQFTNIPLIIKQPDQPEGKIINEVVEQTDIAPTILELAGIPVPSWMEGRSLMPLIQGKDFPSRPVLSMYLEGSTKAKKITEGTFAVWEGDYKLIHYMKDNRSLLFNLKEDPEELKNLFNENHEVGQRLLDLIYDNLKTANENLSKSLN